MWRGADSRGELVQVFVLKRPCRWLPFANVSLPAQSIELLEVPAGHLHDGEFVEAHVAVEEAQECFAELWFCVGHRRAT